MLILDGSIDKRFNTKLIDIEVLNGPLLLNKDKNIIYFDTQYAVDYMWFRYLQNHTKMVYTDSWRDSESVLSPFLFITSNTKGKIDVQCLIMTVEKYGKPGLVYINNTLLTGECYYIDELNDLYSYCNKNGIILYINGDRLSNAICEWGEHEDKWFTSLHNSCDLFSIGGELYGAMFGVPCIISNYTLFEEIKRICYQNGLISSASDLLSRHYEYLINSGAYISAGKLSNQYAREFEIRLKAIGMQTYRNTNHVFVLLNNAQIIEIQGFVKFCIHKIKDNKVMAEFIFHYLVDLSYIDKLINVLSDNYK